MRILIGSFFFFTASTTGSIAGTQREFVGEIAAETWDIQVVHDGTSAKLVTSGFEAWSIDPATGDSHIVEVVEGFDGEDVKWGFFKVAPTDFVEGSLPTEVLVFGNQYVYDGLTGDGLVPNVNNGAIGGDDFSDINGDGRLDLCTRSQTLLTTEDDWRFVPVPNDLDPSSVWIADYHACLPDLDDDGFGELLMAHYETAAGFYTEATGGPISLFTGNPEGHATTPSWTLDDIDAAVYSARAVQADNDPELELALLTANVGYYFNLASGTLLYVLDDVATGNPTVRNVALLGVTGGSPGVLPQLLVLGDLDGDGTDELGIQERVGDPFATGPTHHFRIISTSNPYGSVDTVTTLAFTFPSPNDSPGFMNFRTHDIDEDGILDLYGFSSANNDTHVQVWYGPLYEPPEPIDTSGTGDTAVSPDTALPTVTAVTGDTGGDSTTALTPSNTASRGGCGCTHANHLRSLSQPWFARRRGSR